jgi:hypothetical protein
MTKGLSPYRRIRSVALEGAYIGIVLWKAVALDERYPPPRKCVLTYPPIRRPDPGSVICSADTANER